MSSQNDIKRNTFCFYSYGRSKSDATLALYHEVVLCSSTQFLSTCKKGRRDGRSLNEYWNPWFLMMMLNRFTHGLASSEQPFNERGCGFIGKGICWVEHICCLQTSQLPFTRDKLDDITTWTYRQTRNTRHQSALEHFWSSPVLRVFFLTCFFYFAV